MYLDEVYQRVRYRVATRKCVNIKPKTIFTGDNLPIMRGMNSDSVDLIYLDPPFNSNANYAAPIGSEAAGAEFKDTWTLDDIDITWLDLIEIDHPALNRVIHAALTNSDKSYLIYMAVRLLEMYRVLKPTGSLYLHCDPTMSHYLKIVLDAIFGKKEGGATADLETKSYGHIRLEAQAKENSQKSMMFFSFTQNQAPMIFSCKKRNHIPKAKQENPVFSIMEEELLNFFKTT